MRKLLSVFTAAVLVLTIGACDETPTTVPDASEETSQAAEASGPGGAASASMVQANAPFKNFHQGFNHGVHPWDQFTLAGGNWCGSIEQVTKGEGDVSPSAGRAYATVTQGRCNPPFPPQTSAPASGPFPPLMSTVWPSSGFVHQVDVYLEPGYPAGADGPDYDDPEDGVIEGLVSAPDGSVVDSDEDVVFTYATSLCELNDDGSCPIPFGLRYFSVAVTKDGKGLDVAGHTVTEAGWYTFRYVFGSDEDGKLTVDFQLVDDGRPLVTEPVETTMAATPFFGNNPTSSLEVADLGSGYLWFATIADGLELPIDEHVLRPGK